MERPSLCPLDSWTGQDGWFHLGTPSHPAPATSPATNQGLYQSLLAHSRCTATSDQSLDGDAGDGPVLTDDRGEATGLVGLTPLVRTYVAWGPAASCSHWYPAFLLIITPASSDYLPSTEEKMKDQRGYLPHTAICPTSKGGLLLLSK